MGTADLNGCVISNNTAWRGGGIAVNTNGTLRMSGTLLRDNRATVGGGLVVEGGGKAYLDGCTFEANAATNNMDNYHVGGGGILLYNQGGQVSVPSRIAFSPATARSFVPAAWGTRLAHLRSERS